MPRPLGSNYVLDTLIGRGASGEVWRGRSRDGRTLAFKVLHDSLSRDQVVVHQFVQEREIIVGLNHPGLVRVSDLVVEGNTLAIVMDLVEGGDLRKLISTVGALPPAEVCRLGSAVAGGLNAVHAVGVVHRDVKPENVLLDVSVYPPPPKLTDLGIAKIIEASQTGRSTVLVGSTQYVAPEVFNGAPASPASDMYALGVMLYELSCGVAPFTGPSLSVLRQHAEEYPGRPAGIPDQLWEVIAALLAKDPAVRLISAGRCEAMLQVLAHELVDVPAAPTLANPPPSVPMAVTAPSAAISAPSASSATQAEMVAGAKPDKGHSTKIRAVVIAGIAVVLVAAIAVGVSFLRKGNASQADPPPAGQQTSVPPASTDSPAATDPPPSVQSPASSAVSPDSSSSASPSIEASTGSSPATSETPSGSESSSSSDEVAAGSMPDLVGKTQDEAKTDPALAGVKITIELAKAPEGTPNGVVIDQKPGVGAQIEDSVVLTVASSEAVVYLADLSQITSGSFSSERAQLGGEDQLHALVASGEESWRSEGSSDYNLGKHYASFAALAGIDDNSADNETQVVLEIFGDSRSLKKTTLKFGDAQDLTVDVTGVLRLQIRYTFTSGDGTVVLGNARITAVPGYEPPPDQN